MQWKTETQLRTEYADVLGAEADVALLRVAQDLDAGLHAIEPPAVLWSASWRLPEGAAGSRAGLPEGWLSRVDQERSPLPPALTAGKPLGSDPRVSGGVRKWRIHTKLYAALAVAVAAIIVAATSVTMAGPTSDPITDLGKVTNSIPQAPNPLTGRFHRIGPILTQHGKPELLFIGTMVNGMQFGGEPASERWALVKALNQFGTFTGVTAAVMNRCDALSAHQHQCYPVNKDPYRGYPTFDLSHARYTSRYVTLVAKDVIDLRLHVQTNLSPLERSLVERYIGKYSNNLSGKWDDLAWLISTNPPENHGLPLLSIGGYLQTDYGQALLGDLSARTAVGSVPFSTVQDSLRKGKAVGGLPSSLIFDFNSETNVLTALICHATKNQPKNVCSRPPIRQILKHVK